MCIPYGARMWTTPRLVLSGLMMAALLGGCGTPDVLDEPWPPANAESCLNGHHPDATGYQGVRLATRGTMSRHTERTVTLYFCYIRPSSGSETARVVVTHGGVVSAADPAQSEIPGAGRVGVTVPIQVTVGSGSGDGWVLAELYYIGQAPRPPVASAGVRVETAEREVLITEPRG